MHHPFPWRVIILCHSPHLNGAQRMLAQFILGMDRKRIEPVVVARSFGPGIKILQDAGIPCYEVPFSLALPMLRGAGGPRAYLERIEGWTEQLTRAIVSLEGDLVLVNTSVVIQGVLAAKRAGLPCAVDLRGIMGRGLVPELDTRALRADEATVLTSADGLIAHSDWTRSFVTETYGIDAAAIRIVANGIELPEASSPPPADGPKRFVMLCTLEANKNVMMFLDAAELLLDETKNLDAEFLIYGGGGEPGYKEAVEARLAEAPLKGRVILHNRVEDVNRVYQVCYAAVVTSHIESFSNVLVEAMAHGRPVISTRCGGPEEIILDGETGFLIDFTPQALASRMKELLENPERARAMGEAARGRAETEYDLKRLVTRYEDALSETCEAYWIKGTRKPALAARIREGLADLFSDSLDEASAGRGTARPVANGAAEPGRALPSAIPTPTPDGCELRPGPELLQPVSYEVTPPRAGWSGLRLLVGTHRRRNTCSLRVRITPGNTPDFKLREATITCSGMSDNKWCELRFPPIADSQDARLNVIIEPIEAGPGNAISIYEWRARDGSRSLIARAKRKLLSPPVGALHAELLFE